MVLLTWKTGVSSEGFDNFLFYSTNCLQKLMQLHLIFWQSMKYHFCPRSKPPISTSVALFKRGTSHQSVSQTVADNTRCLAINWFFVLVVFPLSLSLWLRVGRRGRSGNDSFFIWLLFGSLMKRWVSKQAGLSRVSFVGIAPFFCAIATTEDGQTTWHYPMEFATSCRCKKMESIFILRDLGCNHGVPKYL